MDETYRMLGREHDAELEREAARRRLAEQLPRSRRFRRRSVLTVATAALRGLLLELRGAPAVAAPQVRRR